MHHSIVCSGYLVVSPRWIGFWSKSLTFSDQRYRIRSSMVRGVTPIEPKIRTLPVYTLQLDVHGHTSLKFQTCSERTRDEAVVKIRSVIGIELPSSPSATPPRTPNGKSEVGSPMKRSTSLFAPISRTLEKHHQIGISTGLILQLPKAVNIPSDAMYPMPPMHFVCLTIGSRGDVQPYIALALGLKSEGHTVTIVTHSEYKSWIESFGVRHRTAGGDPGMLMKLSVENKVDYYPDALRDPLAHPDSPDVFSPVFQRKYYKCECIRISQYSDRRLMKRLVPVVA